MKSDLEAGSSVGGMMSGILSSMLGGLPNFFVLNQPTPFLDRQVKAKYHKRSGVRRGWTPRYYGVAGPDSREAARRRRQIERGSLRRENGLSETVP